MIVTVWIVVDRNTGDVNATARPLSNERAKALLEQGHEVYLANVGLPERYAKKLSAQTVQHAQILQRTREQRDYWEQRARDLGAT